jgi:hypothetical protein
MGACGSESILTVRPILFDAHVNPASRNAWFIGMRMQTAGRNSEFVMKLITVFLVLIGIAALLPAQTESSANADITALKAEIERLKGMVPDQSHAMKDVAYHFTNLWFAGQKQNWPLADFYLSETRSHLRWAVRIIPVRKTPQGQDLRLADILEPMDKSVLTELAATISGKDSEAFRAKYEQTLNTCYSCHVAAGKPFLRLEIPKQPEVQVIRFESEP